MVKKTDEQLIKGWLDKIECGGRVPGMYEGMVFQNTSSSVYGTTWDIDYIDYPELDNPIRRDGAGKVLLCYLNPPTRKNIIFDADLDTTDFLRALRAVKYPLFGDVSRNFLNKLGLYFNVQSGELLLYVSSGPTSSPRKAVISLRPESLSKVGWIENDLNSPFDVFYTFLKDIISIVQLKKSLNDYSSTVQLQLFASVEDVQKSPVIMIGDKSLFYIATQFNCAYRSSEDIPFYLDLKSILEP